MTPIHLAQLQLLLATPHFASYVANLRSFVKRNPGITCDSDDLIDAFTWTDTPEGDDFWSDLSDNLGLPDKSPTCSSILDYIDANYSPATHPHLYI